MELDDCAFPTLAGVEIGADANKIFDGVNLALLVGARPRGPGMERGDLLEANGAIFTAQGKALNEVAADDVRIGVTGNPANTNALIAMTNAPDIPKERFSALTRLDHNRAISQLAAKTGASVTDIKKMTIWGNHSATQYPDIFHAEVGGKNAAEVVDDQGWLENDFIPTVAKRGAAIIEARGSSSAASAASATIDAAHDWLSGSADGDWVSMAVVSDGSYDVPEGLISSFPVTTSNGDWEIVQGLEIDDFSRGRIDASTAGARRGARRGQGARPDLSEPELREARTQFRREQVEQRPRPRDEVATAVSRPGEARGSDESDADRARRRHRGRRRVRAAARGAAPRPRPAGGHLRRTATPPLADVVRNTLTVLDACGREDVPVAAGADAPLLEERSRRPARARRRRHGRPRLADVRRASPTRGTPSSCCATCSSRPRPTTRSRWSRSRR